MGAGPFFVYDTGFRLDSPHYWTDFYDRRFPAALPSSTFIGF